MHFLWVAFSVKSIFAALILLYSTLEWSPAEHALSIIIVIRKLEEKLCKKKRNNQA